MNQRKVTIRLEGHTSLRLDSGRFLLLPALDQWNAVEDAGPDSDSDPDRATIKAYTRVLPLDATLIGRTLHVTLPIPDFERLGSDLRAKVNPLTELSFLVDDETGDVSQLCVDGKPLTPQATHSYIQGPNVTVPARKSTG